MKLTEVCLACMYLCLGWRCGARVRESYSRQAYYTAGGKILNHTGRRLSPV